MVLHQDYFNNKLTLLLVHISELFYTWYNFDKTSYQGQFYQGQF